MQVLILVHRPVALAAITRHVTLFKDYPINNKKQFRQVIKEYIAAYGALAVDDHLDECSDEESDYAKEIFNKYFDKF